jgi:4'-phosphopantetheinyl transferase
MVKPDLLYRLKQESHVWFVRPETVRDRATLSGFLATLSAEEAERHRRYRFEEDRHRFLVSHALVRQALSRYGGLAPQAWQFSHSENGKPEISNPGVPPLRFNLTHTAGLVACVINLFGECGIDAEKIVPRHRPGAVARRMFSSEEYLNHQALGGYDRLEYFFERWTLREAYVKARGIGIRFPTQKLCFRIDSSQAIRLELAPDMDDKGENWQLALIRPTTQHVLAVAIARNRESPKAIVTREYAFSD